MDYTRIFICIAIMAYGDASTCRECCRCTIFRKKIQNRFIDSFLHDAPYAVLAAMTFPEILYSTENLISGAIGMAVAVALAFWGRGLLTVAIGASASVFIAEQVIHWIGG